MTSPVPRDYSSSPALNAAYVDDNAEKYGLKLCSPIKFVSVELLGLKRVNPNNIKKEFHNLDNVKTLKELLLELEATHIRLDQLGIFKSSVSELHCGEYPGEVKITFHMTEKERSFTLGAHMNSNGNAEFEAEANVPAVFTATQSLSLSYATEPVGSAAQNVISAALSFPRLPWNNSVREAATCFQTGSLCGYTKQKSSLLFNSTSLRQSGLKVALQSEDNSHSVSWEACLRDVLVSFDTCRLASPSVLRTPWRSMKNSVRYDFTHDRMQRLNDSNNSQPRNGFIINASAEAALPGGDARFLKGEIHGFAATPINVLHERVAMSTPWVLSGRFGFGLLIPTDGKSVSLVDKFNITGASGGRAALRGFRSFGIGPRDTACEIDRGNARCHLVNDFLGSETYFTSEVTLSYDLSFPKNTSASMSDPSGASTEDDTSYARTSRFVPRAFIFGNVGALEETGGTTRTRSGIGPKFLDLFQSWRGSVGLGISIPLNSGMWMEGIFSFPVRKLWGDKFQSFQLGVRVSSSKGGE